ncbi:NnrS family protein [Stappia sp. TSB10GB4]|uniref:NnrS family protein n=1 Tax=Stappia sp. TSB10GB4 TaxID=2003584 RepID=UPI0016491034|nr:NnrS family protein [Stappia sp. TSB10GB4]
MASQTRSLSASPASASRTLPPRHGTAAAASSRQGTDGWWLAVAFRPLFFVAALQAVAAVPAWLWIYTAGIAEVAGLPALTWHAHEMVFGFLPPIMAGYLLSATPNWSGRLPTAGTPLALLVGLWLAGRLVPFVAPLPLALAVDAAFPLAVSALLLREMRLGRSGQSRHGLMLFPVLAAAALAHRLFGDDPATAAMMARTGIAVAALLIAAVGGRLVPSLTRNALAGRGAERVPAPYGRFDIFVLLATSAALPAWVLAPDATVTGALLTGAGLLNLARLLRWRGWLLRRGDILALHAGYGWLVTGLLLAALAALPGLALPADAALHALTAGAIGSMTLAVMSRLATTRGPGGYAGRWLCGAALLTVNLGAVLRITAPIAPEHYLPLVAAGGLCWSLAYLLFAVAQTRPLRAAAIN